MSGPAIAIVGAGPVATVMARGLRAAGLPVIGLWARRPEAALAAAASAGVTGFAELPAEMRDAEVILLAVRDEAIAQVAGILVQGEHVGKHAVLLHCSGAHSALGVFSGLGDSVAGRGLLHPLRAIATADSDCQLANTYFGIEGDEPGRAMAARLCHALGGRALTLRSEHMASYHAAAAIASNYLVALIDMASRLMGSAGVDPAMAKDALCELAAGAVENVRVCGLPEALTGPIRRGDRQTIVAHLAAVAENLPQGNDLYRELAAFAVPLAAQIGDADARQLREISELLRRRDEESD